MEANESLAYVAGFVDGEGCIRIVSGIRGPSGVSLHIVNSDEGVIDYINLLLPGRKYNQKRYGRRNLYRLCWSGEAAIDVIELILPYLIVKERIARLVVEYWRKFFKCDELDDMDFNGTDMFLKPGHKFVITEAEIILRKSFADKARKLIRGES